MRDYDLAAPANAVAPFRPCTAGEETSPSAGTADFGTGFARTALLPPLFDPVSLIIGLLMLLFGVNRVAMACNAALMFFASRLTERRTYA
jgi:hypothetical protein